MDFSQYVAVEELSMNVDEMLIRSGDRFYVLKGVPWQARGANQYEVSVQDWGVIQSQSSEIEKKWSYQERTPQLRVQYNIVRCDGTHLIVNIQSIYRFR